MRKQKTLILIIIVSTLLPITAFSQVFYTIGPTINWNFGNKQCKVSGGLEFGIYGIQISKKHDKEAFLGLEFGLDFEKNKTRLYTEFRLAKKLTDRIGIPILYGITAGPVLEWGKDCKTSIGIQTSAYGWCLLGASFRYRYINRKSYYGPGLFFKIPIIPNFKM